MSALVFMGIIGVIGAGVWAISRDDKNGFQLLCPTAYKAEIDSAFSLAMNKLAPLGHKKHGTVRVVVKKGNERYGKRWGYKKPNGNLVGATTAYHPSTGNQVVTLYTDPAGHEESDEILHEMGHVVLNFDRSMAHEAGTYHHMIMKKYGFPCC